MTETYVPLHAHTHYSLLDGLSKVKGLLDRCVEYGMPACAITDHGVLFGAMEFYAAAKERGIKPIIGCELYVAPTNRFDKSGRSSHESAEHLVLLCKNEEGYHNLCRLSSIAHLEGWHYKPRVDDECLAAHSAGLMASSACLSGRIPRLLLAGDTAAADRAAEKYAAIFGRENFFIEIMNHGMPEEEEINPMLADLAKRHGLLLIATNDSHYTDRADAEAHDVLLCVQTNKTLDEPDRMRLPNDEFYLRPPAEMRSLFARWPEALENTLAVADMVDFSMPDTETLIPDFQPPEGLTKVGFLRELVMAGLAARYGDPAPPECLERAEYEMGIIDRMQFTDYFLVVWDLINFARKNGIPVGPGRGSGAGSIVAYALRITNIDPMRYKLLFERFLNPERVSMPDFDIDFCFYRRAEMISYAIDRYGKDNVSQIATFGRMLMKNVVRNVARVLGMPPGEVNRIAKMLPSDPKKSKLADALSESPELRAMVSEDPQMSRLWRLAQRLEGTINSIGTHAAGVVICDHPITDHSALFKAATSATIATQADMGAIEKIGLLKMDFLGLRTLSVVHETVRLVKKYRGLELDIDNIHTDDAKTYSLLRSGQTTGIFQLESSGMRDLARRIGLESIEEMSALVALYRPGPMQFIDKYIDCKHHPERVHYDHPILEEILRETHGIAVYQEQVMQMVQTCAGFSLGHADVVRRAMGKKKKEVLDAQKAEFIEGCKTKGIPPATAGVIWSSIETFAGYGFNKSHSVAYAFVAYQTAYLKAHYPEEYMCALLTSEVGNLEKAAEYIEECRRMEMAVLPPDINHSDTEFSVENGAIRFGLGAIRNLGEAPARAITAERNANGPYRDIYDFCKRLEPATVNMRVVESLNKAGAFASTGWNRRQVAAVMEKALTEGQVVQRDRAAGQTSLFDMGGEDNAFAGVYEKPELPEWADHLIWEAEKEMLGLYISSHPLGNYRDIIRHYATPGLDRAESLREGDEVHIAGIITTVRRITTKKGGRMAFVTVETPEGACEIIVFTDLYERKTSLVAEEMIVIFEARVNMREGRQSFIANEIHPLDDAERELTRAVHVRLQAYQQQTRLLEQLGALLSGASGPCDVYLHCETPDTGEVVLHAPASCRVSPTRQLRHAIEDLLGQDSVFFSGGMRMPSHQPPRNTQPQQPRWKKRNDYADN